MNSLSALSIAEIRAALKQGAISAREIAQQTLENIDARDPALNAYTHITRERMLSEADHLDRARAKGLPMPSLAAIPYAVKNLFDVTGETTLAGASLFSDNPPAKQDAWAIGKLAGQGALLSGMLNMDAYAYGFTTENSHYGATRNPHDTTRIAGGSSGGSAAAVAAGLVTFSLGSDTNGSIRVPASLCGIFGLKPTFGRLSRSGSQPFVASLDHLGPFARRVRDLATVYDVMQGTDIEDRFQADKPVTQTESLLPRGQQGLRCAVLGGYFQQWCNDDAKTAVRQAAQALEAVTEVEFPQAELARSAAFIISAAEGAISICRYCAASQTALSRCRVNACWPVPCCPPPGMCRRSAFVPIFSNRCCRCSNAGTSSLPRRRPAAPRRSARKPCISTARICRSAPVWAC